MIYLVRHGESQWNVERRTQGQTPHPPLTPAGLVQARAAAAALLADRAGAPVTRIASSDLARAAQTAEVIAAATGARVELDPRLREQHLGSFEGLPYEQSFAAGSALDWTDPDLRIGGGESLRELSVRVTAALADAVDGADGATVLVSHGDAIRALLAAREGLLPAEADWVPVANGAVAALDGTGPPRWLTAG